MFVRKGGSFKGAVLRRMRQNCAAKVIKKGWVVEMKMKKWAAALLCGLLLMTDPGVAYAMPDSQAAEEPAATAEEGGYDGSDVPAEDADAVREEPEDTEDEKTESSEPDEPADAAGESTDFDAVSVKEQSPDDTEALLNEKAAVGGTVEIGGKITWSIDGDGKLTVEGTGEFSSDTGTERAPWYSNREQIKTAVVNVQDIKDTSYMFFDCEKMTDVTLSGLDTSQVTNMS
ncbi:MAG TPA: hypothetical protein DD414_03095, partial [Lachnospiraceae bacterium]|nr:hypothetical protein [Lachnospiraceae bacterium]